MAQGISVTIEKLLGDLNEQFQDLHMTTDDLKKPLTLMKAVFKIFEHVGIDIDAVLQPPSERDLNEHLPYYRDLVPIINTIRVLLHLLQGLPPQKITVDHLMCPNVHASTSILLLLLNYMLFVDSRLEELAPHENELLARSKQVQELEERKLQLQHMLNNQAIERGKRAMRVEELSQEVVQLEEQLVVQQQTRDQHRHELDAALRDSEGAKKLLEQKRATLDNLMAEKERLKALRVYDAEDIKAKAAQATQSVQEADEKLSTLGGVIAQKENSLMILQKINPYLDTANNLLDEVSKLKDDDVGDLESDSKDGELQMLTMTVSELKAQLAELKARREQDGQRRRDAQHRREQERIAIESAIRDAEEKAKKHDEFLSLATQRIDQLKDATKQYEIEKITGIQHIREMKENHDYNVQEWEDALMQLLVNVRMEVHNKLHGTPK